MKILLIADVHNRPVTSRTAHNKTLKDIKKAIENNPCDLIAFLGDTVHGPDFKRIKKPYSKYLKEVLDLTDDIPFAYIFGNHDDECDISKEEILKIVSSYPNSVTNGRNYIVDMMDERLLFIDSGSYYNGDGSYYDVVPEKTITWAVDALKSNSKKAILFQHIIMPDIFECIEQYKHFKPFCAAGDGKWVRFKPDVKYEGLMRERPCPPEINNGELERLAPYIKGAVFGHDHKNDFELTFKGIKWIQCAGSGYNCYDRLQRSSVKILNTDTMQTVKIKL